MSSYSALLDAKRHRPQSNGIDPADTHPSLFPFQAALVRWAIRRGQAAIFADTGLGKTRMQLEWLRQMADDGNGLIIAPLAVAEQTMREANAVGSNRVDTVLDPFAGIGTTGHVAVRAGRRFIGIELKRAYWAQACKNLAAAQIQEVLDLGKSCGSVSVAGEP